MRSVILATIALGLVLSGVSRADDKAADKEAKMLDGTWQLVEGVMAGQPLPPLPAAGPGKGITLTLSPGKYVVMAESKDEGTVKYFPDASPKAMEITGTNGPNKGKTFPAIYELKGGTLTVCYDLSGKARPTEFKSKPGTKLFLATYKKAKS
jgi:uncharacterized protein (TIGR03067 family)